MSIYRRGRIWWVKITAPGRPTVRESAGTANQVAAQEYHDKRAAELWRIRRLGERARTAFADVAADWITAHAKDKASFEDDRLRLKVMLPLLPAWLDELTTTRLTAIRDELRKGRTVTLKTPTGRERTVTRAVGRSTANKYLAILSAILHHAHAREWIAAVPAVPMYPKAKRKRFTVLTFEQATTLLNELPAHLAALTRFALATGLRDANVRELKWSEVDLGARVARVWGDEAKAGELIPVPLNEAAVEVLQGQLGQHSEFVFTYEKRIGSKKRGEACRIERRPITKRSNNSAWRKARERAGLPGLRFHDLRHSWATWHKMAGTPDFELQQMGGWSDARMLRVYAHVAAQHLVRHANAITVPRTTQGTAMQTSEQGAEGKRKENREMSGVADGTRTHDNRNHKTEGVIYAVDFTAEAAVYGKARTAKKKA